MKKGFLFGLGILIAGVAVAATISTITVPTKSAGDPVTHQEFNSITSGLNAVTDAFGGTTSDASSIIIPKSLTATAFESSTKIISPEICIGVDCKTSWTTAEGSGVTAMSCPSGELLKSVDGSGVFTCATDQTGGASGIGTLNAGKWCWSLDGTEITCDRHAPGGTAGCTDYQYHKCINNKLWWFDSCDTRDASAPKEDCTSLGGCTAGEIGGTCANSSGGGGTSLWKADAGGIKYDGNHVLAKEFCLNTNGVSDVCSSKNCSSDIGSGAGGATCFTQQTLTDIESILTDGGGYTGWIIADGSSGIPSLGTSVHMYAGVNGNVGIGTTTPDAKLHVVGDVKATGGVQVGNTTTSCAASIGGTLRLAGPLVGGNLYKFQVCMYQGSTWAWYTLMDSANGIPASGQCTPNNGTCK